jgi:hypothetical protein
VEISDKLPVQIKKANGEITIKNSYWESDMLMLLPEATAATLPLLTCDRCMPCNKEN